MNGIDAREINDRELNDLKMALSATTDEPTVSLEDVAKELIEVYGDVGVSILFKETANILNSKEDEQRKEIEKSIKDEREEYKIIGGQNE
jgi:hypothetical protein